MNWICLDCNVMGLQYENASCDCKEEEECQTEQ